MIRFFDLHADIGKELIESKDAGRPVSFRENHMKRLQAGGIQYSAAACFFEGHETWKEMKEMISLTASEAKRHASLILSPDDLDETSDEMMFILTVEGMCGIDRKVKKRISWMYDMGVRMATLTWNDFNTLATGIGGDPARGLTEEGRKAVKMMNALHMVIDVSHANEHTFWDLINASARPMAASHSNCREICNAERNLTDEQIIALTERGGIIGLNSYREFISRDEKETNAAGLARHAAYIAKIAGHEHVAVGFDFIDFLEDYSHFQETDISSAEKAQNLISALAAEGFSEEQIEDIAWRNAFRFFRENL
jgi:membrane dipeptidase